mmetsp:Transcript_4907/g.11681  ORF Transcript_4907/g.11681 Transcript_4907/m.11681 type:complete len:228 (-) Transcript_4907:298-981(-)
MLALTPHSSIIHQYIEIFVNRSNGSLTGSILQFLGKVPLSFEPFVRHHVKHDGSLACICRCRIHLPNWRTPFCTLIVVAVNMLANLSRFSSQSGSEINIPLFEVVKEEILADPSLMFHSIGFKCCPIICRYSVSNSHHLPSCKVFHQVGCRNPQRGIGQVWKINLLLSHRLQVHGGRHMLPSLQGPLQKIFNTFENFQRSLVKLSGIPPNVLFFHEEVRKCTTYQGR